jgi:hypothetical protein
VSVKRAEEPVESIVESGPSQIARSIMVHDGIHRGDMLETCLQGQEIVVAQFASLRA